MVDEHRNEEWRPVVGSGGKYAVSSLGRIRNNGSGRILTGQIGEKGYRRVTLGSRQHRVHRIAYEAFRGSIPLGMEINHKNGNKDDNRIQNLEAVAHRDNMLHSVRVLGNKPLRGSAHWNAKLNEAAVIDIRSRRKTGELLRSIAGEYGVSVALVSKIGLRVGWEHVA